MSGQQCTDTFALTLEMVGAINLLITSKDNKLSPNLLKRNPQMQRLNRLLPPLTKAAVSPVKLQYK